MKSKLPKYKYERKSGTKFAVEYACTRGRVFHVERFLDNLEPRRRARIEQVIHRYHQQGKVFNRDLVKKLQGDARPLLEFRRDSVRIFFYFPQERRGHIVLLTGFEKKGNRTPRSQIKRALNLMKEYEELLKNANA